MKQAPDIRFVGMEPSEALETAALEKIAKLEQFCPQIMACHVVIDLPHRHRSQGRRFAVRVDLTLPGRELAVTRVEHADVYVTLRDAFDHMRRQLEDTMRRMQEFAPPAAGKTEEAP